MNYDLEERCARFGENIIKFAQLLPKNDINKPLISQIVRSSTSVGANYMEANQAASKKDFKNKVIICRKEANETKHWLRMILTANPDKITDCKKFWNEGHELVLIFAKIAKSCEV